MGGAEIPDALSPRSWVFFGKLVSLFNSLNGFCLGVIHFVQVSGASPLSNPFLDKKSQIKFII